MLLVAHRTPLSKSACERLAAMGAQVFEADVQVDDRDHVVVSHYLPVGNGFRWQRDNWRVRWHAPAGRDPDLTDIAALVPDSCLVLLDLKERAPERRARLLEAIEGSLSDPSRVRVCGPRPGDLDQLRDAGFRTWRTVGNALELAALLDGGALPDDAVTIRHTLLTRDVVDRLHELVGAIVAWTVNDVRRARQLRDFGVDGVTTDRAAVLRLLAPASH
jgi:glycerophosphoryl diester phosphodiesterase